MFPNSDHFSHPQNEIEFLHSISRSQSIFLYDSYKNENQLGEMEYQQSRHHDFVPDGYDKRVLDNGYCSVLSDDNLIMNPSLIMKYVPLIEVVCPSNPSMKQFDVEDYKIDEDEDDDCEKPILLFGNSTVGDSSRSMKIIPLTKPMIESDIVSVNSYKTDLTDCFPEHESTFETINTEPINTLNEVTSFFNGEMTANVVSPQQIVRPPPPPLPLVCFNEDEDQNPKDSVVSKSDLEVIYPVIGLRPARRKGTGYADIRNFVPECICSAPYKYQIKVAASLSHPKYEELTANNFEIALEAWENPNFGRNKKNKNSDDDDEEEEEEDYFRGRTRRRRKRKRKKKSSSGFSFRKGGQSRGRKSGGPGRPNEQEQEGRVVKNGLMIELYRKMESDEYKQFVYHVQFLTTTFHSNSNYQIVVKYNGEDESGNRTVQELARTDLFSIIARKKRSSDFRFWENFKIRVGEDRDGLLLGGRYGMDRDGTIGKDKGKRNGKRKVLSSTGNGRRGGGDYPRRTGKKRNRDDVSVRYHTFEYDQCSYVSTSNILTGKRNRKKRKLT